ncbi:MAG: hypothetical protein HY615_10520 [Candidatus Rokubacteria bacterium]|nr:hypothetical protein [Candidatus Rokubacteria bacterium]
MIPRRFPVTFVDFLAYSLRGLSDNGVGNCVMTLDGRVDEARLRRTIRLAMDAEPILGCQFVNHWLHPYWRRRTDLDELPLCRVVEGDENSPAFRKFLTGSIDPSRDPVIEVVVFRGPQHDTLCLKGNHAVADGPSGAWFSHTLIDLYRRLGEEPEYVPTPNVTGVRDLRAFTRKFGFRRRLQAFRAGRATPAASWIFPEYKAKDPFHGYVMLKLPPGRVKALSRYGRDRVATMTSVMLAGLYLAALKVFRPATEEVVTFTTTADLRRFLPYRREAYALSNMSAPGRFRMDPKQPMKYEEALLSIRDQLKRIMKNPFDIASPMPLFMSLEAIPFSLLGLLIRRGVRRVSALRERRWGIANIGEIDPGVFEFEGMAIEDVYFTGPLCVGPGIGLIFSIFRGTLNLNVGLSGRVMDESVARQYLEQVDRELPFHPEAPGSVLTVASAPP